MTLIVGYKHHSKYILASDGRVTNDNGVIESEVCNKVEIFENWALAVAGNSALPALLKKQLFDLQFKPDPVGPLDIELSNIKLDLGKETLDGAALLLEFVHGKIRHVLLVGVSDLITTQNLLVEGQQLIALGCGSEQFLGAWHMLLAVDGPPTTLARAKANIVRAMQVVADINAACNDTIFMSTYDLKK